MVAPQEPPQDLLMWMRGSDYRNLVGLLMTRPDRVVTGTANVTCLLCGACCPVVLAPVTAPVLMLTACPLPAAAPLLMAGWPTG